jgi:hypothetical protein
MAVLTAVFVVATLSRSATTIATWDGRAAPGPWPLFALIVPHVLILAAVLAAAYLTLPATRWLAPDDLARRPRPLGLRVARVLGAPAALLRPLLEARDRREHGRRPLRPDAEHTLLSLLTLPRATPPSRGRRPARRRRQRRPDRRPAAAVVVARHPRPPRPVARPRRSARRARRRRRAPRRPPRRARRPAGDHQSSRPAAPASRGLLTAAGLALTAAALAPLLLVHLWLEAEARKHAERPPSAAPAPSSPPPPPAARSSSAASSPRSPAPP